MTRTALITIIVLLFTQCQTTEVPQAGARRVNEVFDIALHEAVTIQENSRRGNKAAIGKLKFVYLNDSRCPANAMCIRQGAAVTTFEVEPEQGEKQTVRLFIGDYMPDDIRIKRNLTADTALVKLNNNTRYQLLLKQVLPYPGTAADTAKATVILKRA